MPGVNRTSHVPLYFQVKESIKQQIQDGQIAPHKAIPSEPELVTQYCVSRAVVRQALAELVHEGVLYRQHGKGTFVSDVIEHVEPIDAEALSLTQEDRCAIARIKELYACSSDMEAIRLALRIVARNRFGA